MQFCLRSVLYVSVVLPVMLTNASKLSGNRCRSAIFIDIDNLCRDIFLFLKTFSSWRHLEDALNLMKKNGNEDVTPFRLIRASSTQYDVSLSNVSQGQIHWFWSTVNMVYSNIVVSRSVSMTSALAASHWRIMEQF